MGSREFCGLLKQARVTLHHLGRTWKEGGLFLPIPQA